MSTTLATIGTLIDHLPFNYAKHRYLDLPLLLKWAKIPRGSAVLEVGCGDGKIARHVAKVLPCKTYTGIDVDHALITRAESASEGSTKTIFQVGDVCRLPFDAATFDAAIVLDVLHHLANWRKALKEIRRVLKAGGRLLLKEYSIETFTYPGIGSLFQAMFRHPYDHMFDQIEFMTYLKKNGFDITYQNDSTFSLLLVAVKAEKKRNLQ